MARRPSSKAAGGPQAETPAGGNDRSGGRSGSRGGSRKRAAPPPDPVDAALRLAGQLGWDGLSLADIAAATPMKLSELFPHYPSKTALVAAYMARVDAAMLDQMAEEGAADMAEEPLRDRLFSAIMARFDSLQQQRDGVLAIARGAGRDPLSGLCLAAGPLRRSLDAILAAAGLSGDGLAGAIRRKAVGAIYLAAFRAWSRDDSPDMGGTMAALDRLLTRWLPMLERFDRGLRRRPAPGPEAAEAF
ncbi:TetR family transcriptional regulator [Marinibaculum pumilum]|uniref:TetR family transcriptional regulator n=1 Tax=Marinibaculum pumilum TaxID=1766165 RepID=A0ABV7L4U7_9PROT